MVLFWIGAILLVVWGLSSLFPTHGSTITLDPPEILRQRFARGELN